MFPTFWRLLVIALVGCLLGNVNGAIFVSSRLDKDDVRSHGSGNAGLTNYARSYGLKRSLLVILIDMGKTALGAFLGLWLLSPQGRGLEGAMLGGLMVSLGHDFPVFQGFRGGKGILCGFATALVADWRIALILVAVFLLAFLLTRYVSLGSVLAAFAYGAGFTAFYWGRPWVILLGWLTGGLAIFMHRGNIRLLVTGTERKMTFGKEKL